MSLYRNSYPACPLLQVDRSGEYISLMPFSEKTCTDIPVPRTHTTRRSCEGGIWEEAIRNTCSCQHATMLDSWEDKRKSNICEPLDVISCRERWEESFPHISASRHCPTICQKIVYHIVADGSPIKRPMLDNIDLFLGDLTPADSGRNITFSVVILFYPTLISKMIQLSKPTLIEWLSAFGGQMSLFIGASVITMLEMLCFIVRVLTTVGGRLFGPLFGRPRVGSLTEE